MDRDGDWDVIIGEHNLANPANAKLYIFENTDVTPTATPTVVAPASPTATVTPTATETGGCTPLGSNGALNGDFENGTTSWSFYTNAGDSFTTASPAHHCQQAARLQFSGSGNNMQFFQSGLVLEPNTRYRLSFAAYSSSGRNLGVYLHKLTAGYESYGLDLATVDLTTQWQSFSYEFTTRNFTTLVQDGRLRFWFAGLAAAGDTYWIDAVHLHKVAGVTSAALAEAGEPLSGTVNLPAFALVQGSEQPTVTAPVAIHGLVTQLVDDGVTQSDQPAAGVTVQVYVDMLAGGTLVASLTTDANGSFVVPELPTGLYTLPIVPPPGYTAAQPDFIERNAETTVVIHVALQPLRQLYLPLVAR